MFLLSEDNQKVKNKVQFFNILKNENKGKNQMQFLNLSESEHNKMRFILQSGLSYKKLFCFSKSAIYTQEQFHIKVGYNGASTVD